MTSCHIIKCGFKIGGCKIEGPLYYEVRCFRLLLCLFCTNPHIPQATVPRNWEPPVDTRWQLITAPAFASTPSHPFPWLHSIWCMSSFVDHCRLLIRGTPARWCYQQDQLECRWLLTWIEVEKSSRGDKIKKKCILLFTTIMICLCVLSFSVALTNYSRFALPILTSRLDNYWRL